MLLAMMVPTRLWKDYLLSRKDELDAHHNKFEQKITSGYNRRPILITYRIKMEDAVASDVEAADFAAKASAGGQRGVSMS